MEHYQVVGQNNRNLLVQLKKVAPYHEDITRKQPFEPSIALPGQWTKIKMDFKHATDREIILNDIRLQFTLDFSTSSHKADFGRILVTRATDLIRQLVIKVNEDIVFRVDQQYDLSFLWEMNNHRLLGDPMVTSHSLLMNHGIIPSGHIPAYYLGTTNQWWFGVEENHVMSGSGPYFNDVKLASNITNLTPALGSGESQTDFNGAYSPMANPPPTWILTQVGDERHDGRPRIVWDWRSGNPYAFTFNVSLNQICGPIFNKLKMRRVEYIQIELMFEPFVNKAGAQNFIMMEKNVSGYSAWQDVQIKNLTIQQYRTTLIDGTEGFTLCDHKMLSWLGHRYSKRAFEWDFSNPNQTYLDIQLHDWEIRTNIVRICWMLAPKTPSYDNDFCPLGEPGDYEYIYSFEIRWKNDVVLDLDNTFDVYRHYVFSENKRHHFEDPFLRFSRLSYEDAQCPILVKNATSSGSVDLALPDTVDDENNEVFNWCRKYNKTGPTEANGMFRGDNSYKVGKRRYEFPVYHADLNMNILYGVPGTETIGGIVNDTSDYVIRIKRPVDRPQFINQTKRTLWVCLEYQTLVNLSGGSNQFNRGSQVVTKQLNPQ